MHRNVVSTLLHKGKQGYSSFLDKLFTRLFMFKTGSTPANDVITVFRFECSQSITSALYVIWKTGKQRTFKQDDMKWKLQELREKTVARERMYIQTSVNTVKQVTSTFLCVQPFVYVHCNVSAPCSVHSVRIILKTVRELESGQNC